MPVAMVTAFWAVVDANRPSEDSELADRIDMLQNPDALTLKQLIEVMTTGDLSNWLTDRRNRRAIPHRLERCGYVPVRNPDADDGYWKIGTRQVVYAKSTLTKADQFKAVTDLMRRLNAAAGTDR